MTRHALLFAVYAVSAWANGNLLLSEDPTFFPRIVYAVLLVLMLAAAAERFALLFHSAAKR